MNRSEQAAGVLALVDRGTLDRDDARAALSQLKFSSTAIDILLGQHERAPYLPTRAAGNVEPLHPAGTFSAEREAARALMRSVVKSADRADDLSAIATDPLAVQLAMSAKLALVQMRAALLDLDRLYAKKEGNNK